MSVGIILPSRWQRQPRSSDVSLSSTVMSLLPRYWAIGGDYRNRLKPSTRWTLASPPATGASSGLVWRMENGSTAAAIGTIDDVVAQGNDVTILLPGAYVFSNSGIGMLGRAVVTGFEIYAPFINGVIYWRWGTGGTGGELTVSGLSFNPNDTFAFTRGPRGAEIWLNGQRVAQNTSATSIRYSDTNNCLFALGSSTTDGQQLAGLLTLDRQAPEGFLADATVDFWGVTCAPIQRRIYVPSAGTTAQTKTHDINSAIQKADSKVIDVNAALQKQFTKTTDINAALSIVGTKTVDINGAIQQVKVAYHYIDSALQKTLSTSVELNAALQKALTATFELNAALQQAKSSYVEINAELISSVATVKTHAINAALQIQKTHTVDINAALEQAKSTYNEVNAVLQKVRSEIIEVNAALQKTLTGYFELNSAIQDTISTSHEINAALSSNKSTYFEINSVLAEGTKAEIHEINAALQKQLNATVDINAALTGASSYTTSLVIWG